MGNERRIKLSIISPDLGDACSLYRAFGPYSRMPEVEVKGYAGKDGFFLWQAIMFADVVLVQRPWTEQHASIIETVRAAGKPCIVDWDDDLSCVPEWNPQYHHFKNCLPALEKCAKIASAVTVTTDCLAEKVRSWGATNVHVIKNAIDDSFKLLPKLQRKKIVAWRGSNTHNADIELFKEKFIQAEADGYMIAFLGDPPAWSHQLKQRMNFPVADYVNFICLLNSLAPEFMFVPLVDHQFNHAKSDIAAQECYLVGAKLIHNSVGEYKGLPDSQPVRWLSDVNWQRSDLLEFLTST